jgi:flagellum-specific ATP synthase
VLQSVSRLVGEVVSAQIRDAGRELRSLLAAHRNKADLIAVGAYERGTDPLADRAIELKAEIDAFLRQSVEDATPGPDADARLLELLASGPPAELVPAPAPAPRAPGPSAIPPLNIAV